MTSRREELFKLLGLQTERSLSASEAERLSELLRHDETLIDDYVDYMGVHGLLFWDVGSVTAIPVASDTSSPVLVSKSPEYPIRAVQSGTRWFAVAAAMVAIIASWMLAAQSTINSYEVAGTAPTPAGSPSGVTSEVSVDESLAEDDSSKPRVRIEPLVLNSGAHSSRSGQVAPPELPEPERSERVFTLPDRFDDMRVVSLIDKLIDKGLEDNGVAASPQASNSEWLRRAYLTIVGRIPSLDESRHFLSSKSPRRHTALVDLVINTPERSEHLATMWTNLLVGRTPKSHVNRNKLHEFLQTAFANNKPWIDTVGELITARGRNDQNGATNFLLAHLNNQATPATAVTARLFLGEQISCVQCHDHPFAPGVTQREYWGLNAFFKDTERVSVSVANSSSKGMKNIPWRLVDKVRPERMTHFETRSGTQLAVLPTYNGQILPELSRDNRRDKLAELLVTDSNAKVGRAMVNRMWAHFFGYGFTPDVDDMGAHATVSHPELLNVLTEAFVKSGYDVRRLMIWIASTAAWQRSSEIIAANSADRPDHGEAPLFSRVYLRRMTPEQVYESVRVAIRSTAGVPIDTNDEDSGQHRREWVQQFSYAYNTDENDESMGFDGSVSQAMVMMNDSEVSEAIAHATNAIVSASQKHVAPISETIERLAMAVLNRTPTPGEESAFRSRYRRLAAQTSPKAAMPSTIEDMMWAYLNSSEFVLVH